MKSPGPARPPLRAVAPATSVSRSLSLCISVSLTLWALGIAGCSEPASQPAQRDLAQAENPDLASVPDLAMPPPPDLLPPPPPMYLTGSFDAGSSPFRSWVATMEFSRELATTYKKSLKLTYFVTTAFYDTTVTGSGVGRAQSRDEVLVRWALTQQALNEGHEVANHTVRHLDGSAWSAEQWRSELKEYQDLLSKNLFLPVRDDHGDPVFPRFAAAPGAAKGAVGAACTDVKDCSAGLRCAMVTAAQGFCTQDCNATKACPSGTFCGYPDEGGTDFDICLPRPAFPIQYQGQELFRADGTPNLSHPALHPYVPVGFRAPQLETNTAMYDVLKELGYIYDSSQVDAPDLPYRYKGVLEFSLMRFSDSLAIPMDYNYMVHMDADGSVMDKDYRRSIQACYGERGKMPWHIGHHLRNYSGGAYFETFKKVFRYAAQGCPDDQGRPRCQYIEFPTMRELAARYAIMPFAERLPQALLLPPAARAAAHPSCDPK